MLKFKHPGRTVKLLRGSNAPSVWRTRLSKLLTVVYLDIVLFSAGGVIGTMHHLYFSGTRAQHRALGAFFSAGRSFR